MPLEAKRTFVRHTKGNVVVQVANSDGKNEVLERIKQMSDIHQIRDDAWLVRTTLTVNGLADRLGVGKKHHGAGIVFQLVEGAYWGRADQDTWDWLNGVRKTRYGTLQIS